jgi:hypothetical protein
MIVKDFQEYARMQTRLGRQWIAWILVMTPLFLRQTLVAPVTMILKQVTARA